MELKPREQSVARRFDGQTRSAVGGLLRTSIYCSALAALFLYLALTRDDPRYAIGIFGMFVVYLAIRLYSARQISGIMPRILQQYEFRIAELEARLRKAEGDKSGPTDQKPMT